MSTTRAKRFISILRSATCLRLQPATRRSFRLQPEGWGCRSRISTIPRILPAKAGSHNSNTGSQNSNICTSQTIVVRHAMRGRQRLLLCALAVLNAAVPSGQQPAPAGANNPLAASPTAATEGQTRYNQLCQTCHGPAGQGGGDRGPALDSGTFTHGSGDGDLFRAIRSGVRGTQMPPFAGLSDTQIWQIVAYLRSLRPATP